MSDLVNQMKEGDANVQIEMKIYENGTSSMNVSVSFNCTDVTEDDFSAITHAITANPAFDIHNEHLVFKTVDDDENEHEHQIGKENFGRTGFTDTHDNDAVTEGIYLHHAFNEAQTKLDVPIEFALALNDIFGNNNVLHKHYVRDQRSESFRIDDLTQPIEVAGIALEEGDRLVSNAKDGRCDSSVINRDVDTADLMNLTPPSSQTIASTDKNTTIG